MLALKESMHSVNPSPALNAINKLPLGSLSILPRELRDEIYSHVLSEDDYRLSFSYRKRNRDRSSTKQPKGAKRQLKWEGSHHNIIRTSSVIREEVVAILIARGVFEFTGRGFDFEEVLPNDVPFVDSIRNIEANYAIENCSCFGYCENAYCEDGYCDGFSMEQAVKADLLSCFTGATIPRNSCAVTLNYCTPDVAKRLLDSPFMAAMSQLKGFKTVTLTLNTPTLRPRHAEAISDLEDREHLYEVCEMAIIVACALEPTLGPAEPDTIRGFTYEGARRSGRFECTTTFHPQQYLAKKCAGGDVVTQTKENTAIISKDDIDYEGDEDDGWRRMLESHTLGEIHERVEALCCASFDVASD